MKYKKQKLALAILMGVGVSLFGCGGGGGGDWLSVMLLHIVDDALTKCSFLQLFTGFNEHTVFAEASEYERHMPDDLHLPAISFTVNLLTKS